MLVRRPPVIRKLQFRHWWQGRRWGARRPAPRPAEEGKGVEALVPGQGQTRASVEGGPREAGYDQEQTPGVFPDRRQKGDEEKRCQCGGQRDDVAPGSSEVLAELNTDDDGTNEARDEKDGEQEGA